MTVRNSIEAQWNNGLFDCFYFSPSPPPPLLLPLPLRSHSPPPSPPLPLSSPPADITYTFHDLRPDGCRPASDDLTVEATVEYPILEGESASNAVSAGSKRPKNKGVG